ncbi:repressor LexA [Candidatus Shapirobacteria bacterium CG_4_10_14_3_um_filter_35_13]|uniref:Repressor LexA n=1 Tax=Candidatus Shapirobacteria bacterium CG_4_10_14_3_um_filter_35_13 TaxID=1974873 RepID=A0A2M7LIJ8_9BACT|nr:MAG: repressor LexA [Candidatus Shapirobacteria bacterium CG_4_10_14_3_um_filter_35_13]
MKDTTPSTRQIEMLKILYGYIRDTGYPPTFEEMRESLKVASNQSVIDLLTKLEEKKLIKRSENSARGINILPLGYEYVKEKPLVPFLGISHAEVPIDVSEIAGNWESVSSDLRLLTDEVFMVEVIGDSMINASIFDGDYALIKSAKEFSSGDIVLANIAGRSTIKRFISDDKPPYLYLKPENPNYQIILCTSEVELKGKVIHVINKQRKAN